MRFIVASGNAHKVAELKAMLRGADVRGVRDLDYGPVPEVEETADTFAGNAELKARGTARWLRSAGEAAQTWVLADDSGISVDALQGAPGVRSARFAGPQSDDAANNARLVAELEALGLDRSHAHYSCVLALCRVGGGEMLRFDGRWDVEVRLEARGSGGFGYDPHAWLGDRTVAELDREEKAALSHRAAALRKLVAQMADEL